MSGAQSVCAADFHGLIAPQIGSASEVALIRNEPLQKKAEISAVKLLALSMVILISLVVLRAKGLPARCCLRAAGGAREDRPTTA